MPPRQVGRISIIEPGDTATTLLLFARKRMAPDVGVDKPKDGDQFVHVDSVAGWNEALAHALEQDLDACGGSLGVDWTRHVRVDPTLSPTGPSEKTLDSCLS